MELGLCPTNENHLTCPWWVTFVHSALDTVLPSGLAAGWTLLDKMYVLNGTVYIVTDQPDIVPDRKFITSTGADIGNSREEVQARLPTDRDMRIISPEEAKKLFGTGANRVEGLTVSIGFCSRTNLG